MINAIYLMRTLTLILKQPRSSLKMSIILARARRTTYLKEKVIFTVAYLFIASLDSF